MTIRMLRVDEFDMWESDLCAMIRDSAELSFPQMQIGDGYVRQKLESMRRHLEEGDAIVLVAEDREGIEGFIWCHEIVRVMERRLHISHFYVKKSYRRRGIGTLLVREAEKYAFDRQCSGMDLMVTAANRDAVGFYERNDFSVERYLMSRSL